MTLIDRIFGRSESRSSLANPAPWLTRAFGGGETTSGEVVTEAKSLQQTAVWSATGLIAGAIGSLPLHTYRRLERGKQAAVEHHLYDLLHDAPNTELNSQTYFEMATLHILLWGNHYSEIERNGAGQVIGLWPLMPWNLPRVFRRNGLKLYEHVADGRSDILPAEKVFHVPGLGFDGLRGLSVIRNFAETLGVNIATEKFGASFFRNGSRPSVMIEWDGDFASQEDRTRWLREYDEKYAGVTNVGKSLLLKKGMKATALQINPDDAQFLESRNFGVKEIARMFNVPSSLLNDTDGSVAFASAEQKTSDFLTFTLRSWLTRWQAAIRTQLVPLRERKTTPGGIFVEFKAEDLLRVDPAAQATAFGAARNGGWMSANDIRAAQNLNPIGPAGDIYLVPLNMVDAESLLDGSQDPPSGDEPPDPEPDPEPASRQDPDEGLELRPEVVAQLRKSLERPGQAIPHELAWSLRSMRMRRRIENSHKSLIQTAAQRAVRREVEALTRALRKAAADTTGAVFARGVVETWIQDFYPEHADYIRRQLEPVYLTLGETIYAEAAGELNGSEELSDEARELVRSMSERTAQQMTNSSRGQLRAIMRDAEDDEVFDRLTVRSQEWSEKAAGKIADRESVQVGQAVAKVAWAAAGATALRWVAVGENCPLCDELDGRVIGIRRSFVALGDVVKGKGVSPLTVDSDKSHPPLHEGCDCMIVPD